MSVAHRGPPPTRSIPRLSPTCWSECSTRGWSLSATSRSSSSTSSCSTIQIRLLVASVDKAREMGIDWWATNPDFCPRKTALADDERAPCSCNASNGLEQQALLAGQRRPRSRRSESIEAGGKSGTVTLNVLTESRTAATLPEGPFLAGIAAWVFADSGLSDRTIRRFSKRRIGMRPTQQGSSLHLTPVVAQDLDLLQSRALRPTGGRAGIDLSHWLLGVSCRGGRWKPSAPAGSSRAWAGPPDPVPTI